MDDLPPILLPDGEPIPSTPRYRMTNFRRNVRVDLSDREIRIPREHGGFREVRQPAFNLNLNMDRGQGATILNVGFVTFAVMAVILMIFNIVNMTSKDVIPSMIVSCAIFCFITLIFALIKNGIRSYHSWLWAFNTVIWSFQIINYF